MKESKRVARAVKTLENIEEILDYFLHNSGHRGSVIRDINDLKELLKELSLDQKLDHARFAKKLKTLWKKSA